MSEPTIPAGTYPARAVEAVLGTSNLKGTEYIGVTFEITDPELAGEHIKYQGWLSEKALPYTIKALQNAGWKGDDIENAMAEGLGSIECDITIEWEDYKDKTRAKVVFVNAPAKPLDGSRKKSIRDRVKAAVKNASKTADDGGPKVDPDDNVPY